MKLIEKIEALYGKAYGYDENSNAVINDVLDIIQAEFAEKDKPDSEGWWWLYEAKDSMWSNTELVITLDCVCLEYTQIEINKPKTLMFYQMTFGGKEHRYCDDVKGTWIKAIVPTKDGV